MTSSRIAFGSVLAGALVLLGARTGGSGSSAGSPPKLKAIAVSSHEVELGWIDDTQGEIAFEIQRAEGGSPFAPLASLPPDSRHYDDTTVVPVTTYAYRVRAVLPSGPSLWSNVDTVTTPKNHRPRITCSLPQGFERRLTAATPPRPDHFEVTVTDPDGDPVSLTLLNPSPGLVFLRCGTHLRRRR